jgi:hypothetical protein
MILGFSGCYKDIIDFDPYENAEEEIKGDIDDFFANIPDNSVTQTIDIEEANLIITENQTIFQVFENSFVLPDGTLAQGNIEFKYIELLNPAHFAFHGLPTISGGKILKTEGVYKFEAYQDGKELQLKDGKSITVRLPVENPDPNAELFIASGEGENFNWERLDLTEPTNTNGLINEWGFEIDSSIQDFISGVGYEFDCPLWNWINVDIFVDVPESDKTSVCVELPEIYTDKNTLVLMLFKDIESILALYPNSDNQQFCEPYGATPIGYKVIFIVISNQGDDVFHFGISEATITENHVEYIEPEEKSIEDILKIIEDL